MSSAKCDLFRSGRVDRGGVALVVEDEAVVMVRPLAESPAAARETPRCKVEESLDDIVEVETAQPSFTADNLREGGQQPTRPDAQWRWPLPPR